jgi:hypothetical protein
MVLGLVLVYKLVVFRGAFRKHLELADVSPSRLTTPLHRRLAWIGWIAVFGLVLASAIFPQSST